MKKLFFVFIPALFLFGFFKSISHVKAQSSPPDCSQAICTGNDLDGFECDIPNCIPVVEYGGFGVSVCSYCKSPETTSRAIFRPGECEIGDGPDTIPGIQTALGCIPTRPQVFVTWLFKYAISIGAGIAFLMMILGVFQIMTSAGNPEKLNQGKEIMVSAGAGLLFIIFSVFILELIGVKILRIPGWR